jgi:DNA-binding response OmpR family regulator
MQMLEGRLSEMPEADRGRVLVLAGYADEGDELAGRLARFGYGSDVIGSGLAEGQADDYDAIVIFTRVAGSAAEGLSRRLRLDDPVVPIVCLTGLVEPEITRRLLAAGADDVLDRAVSGVELAARLGAHIRKAGAVEVTRRPVEQADRPEVEVDLVARRVRVDGRPVNLGRLEFNLVEHLSSRPGLAVSWEELLDVLYGLEADVQLERLEILVRRVRAKLGERRGSAGNLVAVPGYGYRWQNGVRRVQLRRAV